MRHHQSWDQILKRPAYLAIYIYSCNTRTPFHHLPSSVAFSAASLLLESVQRFPIPTPPSHTLSPTSLPPSIPTPTPTPTPLLTLPPSHLLSPYRTQQRPSQRAHSRAQQHIPQQAARARAEEAIRRVVPLPALLVLIPMMMMMLMMTRARRPAIWPLLLWRRGIALLLLRGIGMLGRVWRLLLGVWRWGVGVRGVGRVVVLAGTVVPRRVVLLLGRRRIELFLEKGVGGWWWWLAVRWLRRGTRRSGRWWGVG